MNDKQFWKGKPETLPYVFNSHIVFSTIMGLFFLCIGCTLAIGFAISIVGLLAICLPIIMIVVGFIAAISPLVRYFELRNILYEFTEGKIKASFGLIGIDTNEMNLDQVSSVYVERSISDEFFKQNTGSIYIISQSGSPIIFHNIKNPDEVADMIKEVTFDIRTDVEYPNALRPDENPGYQTKYTPGDNK